MTDCDTAKCAAELIASALGSLAILAGGWWFLYTTQFKPRIQFDLDCRLFPLALDRHIYLAEVSLMFENKGFVEHRLYDLSLSIHGLDLNASMVSVQGRPFVRTLFPGQFIVPHEYKFYFVRPGVRQVITHELILDEPGPLIEVTSGFNYQRQTGWPHTARRVFSVPTALKLQEQAPNPGPQADG